MRISWLFLLSLLPFLASAQDMARVRQNLNAFDAPEMYGRSYLNRGDRKAAEYIRNKFKEAGLKPFSGDYFQHFQLSLNTIQEVSLKVDGKALKPGIEFCPKKFITSGKGTLKIYQLDTLLFYDKPIPKEAFKKFKGKAILIPERFSGHFEREFHNPKPPYNGIFTLHPQKLTISRGELAAEFPEFDLLGNTVTEKSKEIAYKVKAELIRNYETQNVIGFIPGKVHPDSFIVFSASYDHLGLIGEKHSFPGTDDKARSIALLLELIHFYAKPENQPNLSVAFMAFAGQEEFLAGSRHFERFDPVIPRSKIKFLINLKLVGTGQDGLLVVNSGNFKKEFNHLQKINSVKNYFSDLKTIRQVYDPYRNNIYQNGSPFSFDYAFDMSAIKSFSLYTLDQPEISPQEISNSKAALINLPELFNLLIEFASFLNPKS